jgi:hypothetical protein
VGSNKNEERARLHTPDAPALAAETLRQAAVAGAPPQPPPAEERTPFFWRLFGTTLLSIAALVAITLYQQLTGNIHELRNEVKAFSEGLGDLVKKEEFNGRGQAVANSIKELQATNAAAMDLWRERAALLDRQIKAGEEDLKQQVKELNRELQRLRERLAVAESRQAGTAPPDRPAAALGGKR